MLCCPRDGLRLPLNRSLSEPGPEPTKRCKLEPRSLPASPCADSATLQRALVLQRVRALEPDSLASRMARGPPPLVLDCRPFLAFNANHIRGSVNVNCNDRFNRRRLQQGKAGLADLATTREGKELLKRRSLKEVVVYDESTQDVDLPASHPLFLILTSLVEDNKEPALLLGDAFASLQYLFRIPPCTIGRIVNEVCQAIFNHLKEEYLKAPSTPEELKEYEAEFASKWQFPHCFGAIDGKHITMVAPAHSGSLYYNYKNTHSIVLMAVADANYKFIYVDVGCNGRISDGGVFSNCSLHKALESKQLPLPEPEALPGRLLTVPYVMVADDAFAMTTYILKPYGYRNQPAPNRIFNYRLSRARRIIENAFGIMSSKFRVLRKPMNVAPDKVRNVTLATCVLHNFLISTSPHYVTFGSVDYEDQSTHETTNGEWRKEPTPEGAFVPLQNGHQRNYSVSQKDVRDEFREYFMTRAGELDWQYRFITS